MQRASKALITIFKSTPCRCYRRPVQPHYFFLSSFHRWFDGGDGGRFERHRHGPPPLPTIQSARFFWWRGGGRAGRGARAALAPIRIVASNDTACRYMKTTNLNRAFTGLLPNSSFRPLNRCERIRFFSGLDRVQPQGLIRTRWTLDNIDEYSKRIGWNNLWIKEEVGSLCLTTLWSMNYLTRE